MHSCTMLHQPRSFAEKNRMCRTKRFRSHTPAARPSAKLFRLSCQQRRICRQRPLRLSCVSGRHKKREKQNGFHHRASHFSNDWKFSRANNSNHWKNRARKIPNIGTCSRRRRRLLVCSAPVRAFGGPRLDCGSDGFELPLFVRKRFRELPFFPAAKPAEAHRRRKTDSITEAL